MGQTGLENPSPREKSGAEQRAASPKPCGALTSGEQLRFRPRGTPTNWSSVWRACLKRHLHEREACASPCCRKAASRTLPSAGDGVAGMLTWRHCKQHAVREQCYTQVTKPEQIPDLTVQPDTAYVLKYPTWRQFQSYYREGLKCVSTGGQSLPSTGTISTLKFHILKTSHIRMTRLPFFIFFFSKLWLPL